MCAAFRLSVEASADCPKIEFVLKFAAGEVGGCSLDWKMLFTNPPPVAAFVKALWITLVAFACFAVSSSPLICFPEKAAEYGAFVGLATMAGDGCGACFNPKYSGRAVQQIFSTTHCSNGTIGTRDSQCPMVGNDFTYFRRVQLQIFEICPERMEIVPRYN